MPSSRTPEVEPQDGDLQHHDEARQVAAAEHAAVDDRRDGDGQVSGDRRDEQPRCDRAQPSLGRTASRPRGQQGERDERVVLHDGKSGHPLLGLRTPSGQSLDEQGVHISEHGAGHEHGDNERERHSGQPRDGATEKQRHEGSSGSRAPVGAGHAFVRGTPPGCPGHSSRSGGRSTAREHPPVCRPALRRVQSKGRPLVAPLCVKTRLGARS
jgi:hypothetical protein